MASSIELAPVREDYATAGIPSGFNWAEYFSDVEVLDLYLVVFRSERRVGADVERLTEYDDFAHEEAMNSAGFHYYFKGQAAESRECLSFCLWESREHARAAARGAHHRLAVGITEEMYDSYDLERYIVKKRNGKLAFRRLSPQQIHSPSVRQVIPDPGGGSHRSWDRG